MEAESESDPNLRLVQDSAVDPGQQRESIGSGCSASLDAATTVRIPKRRIEPDSSGQLFTAEQATTIARMVVTNWRRSTPTFAYKSRFFVLGQSLQFSNQNSDSFKNLEPT